MLRWFEHRLGHYALLMAALVLLTLPNLGNHTLWDIDEGLNAEAAREMLEGQRWVVPTFNFELRSAKPPLLYWGQILSYQLFGVSEFAARLPSVLASLLTVLLVYELGRQMFNARTGLMGGLILASAFEFCLLAHAATPDAVLLLATVLTLTVFWLGSQNGSRAWWYPTAAAAGLAVLAKGPIGVGLPGLIILLYFAWNGELSRLWDRRLLTAGALFWAVAGPWYLLVTLATKGQFLKDFIGTHNVHRFLAPMENHSGPIYFHLLGLFVFFMPWSICLVASLIYGVRAAQQPSVPGDAVEKDRRAHRLLVTWFGVVLVFFSLAATKLPNYVLPLYPALALLTASYLERWRSGVISPGNIVMFISWVGLILVGVGIGFGLLLVGGLISLPGAKIPMLSGLGRWWWLGLIPITAAGVVLWYYRRGQRNRVIQVLTVAAILFMTGVAGFPPVSLDRHKAPRALVDESGARQLDREIRLGAWEYFQPSLVFYAGREVKRLVNAAETRQFLGTQRPAFLFVPANWWRDHGHEVGLPHRVVARQYDFYRQGDILVIRNLVD